MNTPKLIIQRLRLQFGILVPSGDAVIRAIQDEIDTSSELTATQKKLEAAEKVLKDFDELITCCEWFAENGTQQELHHFLAVEARGNYGQRLEFYRDGASDDV